jgi:hypothetical protein
MLGIRYYKAEPTTFVVKTVNGKTKSKGKGLSFFYNVATTSIAAVPVNAQEAPFIFNLQTADFQAVKVQGQITFRVANPESIAGILNFNLKKDGVSYLSDDPLKLNDRVVRSAQTIVQNEVQNTKLRDAFVINTKIAQLIQEQLATDVGVNAMGIEVLNTMVGRISADPETARALEAEARELILQEADDAVYGRRKAAVEQERLIKEAELQTDLSVQQKEQEIAESRVENEREILRGKAMTDAERVQASIDRETQRQSLVQLQSDNRKQESDTEAYAVTVKMQAFKTLPVENLKAMALANMNPDQLMAMAFESLAQNAGKIGELNITPDLFGNMMKKAVKG